MVPICAKRATPAAVPRGGTAFSASHLSTHALESMHPGRSGISISQIIFTRRAAGTLPAAFLRAIGCDVLALAPPREILSLVAIPGACDGEGVM
jgi:hypothetical protein